VITSNRVDLLIPEMSSALHKLQSQLEDQGLTLVVINTIRSFEDQDKLFAAKLSPYRGGLSRHHYGQAFSAVLMRHGAPVPERDSAWLAAGAAAEQHGMLWGGRYHAKFKDHTYFEWPSSRSVEALYREKVAA
jgi:hypothetical protein